MEKSQLVVIKRNEVDYNTRKGILLIPFNIDGKDSGQLVMATPAGDNKIKIFYDHSKGNRPQNPPITIGIIENIDNLERIQGVVEKFLSKDVSGSGEADELLRTIIGNTKFERD